MLTVVKGLRIVERSDICYTVLKEPKEMLYGIKDLVGFVFQQLDLENVGGRKGRLLPRLMYLSSLHKPLDFCFSPYPLPLAQLKHPVAEYP